MGEQRADMEETVEQETREQIPQRVADFER
jgi:hypothetical protein